MATKSLKIGDLFESDYDDEAGSKPALETDGIVRVSRAPTDPNDVVRNQDVATISEPFLLVALPSDLTDARVWEDGNGIESTDNGADSTFVVKVKENQVDHNALKNYDEAEHRKWEESISQNIHKDNITEEAVTQHEQAIDTYPRRESDLTQPTPSSGELMVWHDASLNKLYLLYNDPSLGVKKVELT